jgi:hypothetical protein
MVRLRCPPPLRNSFPDGSLVAGRRRAAGRFGRDGRSAIAALTEIKVALGVSGHKAQVWQPIATAPFDRDLELAVIDGEGPHPLVFPCRRILHGWMKAQTLERLEVRPTHWRPWSDGSAS